MLRHRSPSRVFANKYLREIGRFNLSKCNIIEGIIDTFISVSSVILKHNLSDLGIELNGKFMIEVNLSTTIP